MTTYTLGGGCFWCLDAVFRRINGVVEVMSGYAGGESSDPTYYQGASGKTGHAEVVQVTFDESTVSSQAVLDVFFTLHDPTTRNRQGADEGSQYRSILLYVDEQQHIAFTEAVKRAQAIWDDPIVTELAQLDMFYPAEPEHQDYFNKNPANGYCSIVINPKLIKVRKKFTDLFLPV